MSNIAKGQTAQATQASTARGASTLKRVWKHWKWFAGLLLVIVILFGWRSCVSEHKEDAPVAQTERSTPSQAQHNAPAQEAQTERSASSQAQHNAPTQEAPAAQRVTTQLTLKEESWTEVVGYQGQCTWFLTPPGATFAVQARESKDGAWVDWDKKTFQAFQALRFRGTAVTIVQGPTQDGSCVY